MGITHSASNSQFECFSKTSGGAKPTGGFKDAVKAGFKVMSPKSVDFKLTDKTTTANLTDCFKKKFTAALPTDSFYQNISLTDLKFAKTNDTSMHASLMIQSQQHVVDLHNFVRALAIKHKFAGYGKALVAHQHTLTDEMAQCAKDLYNETSLTVTWDDTTLINLKSTTQTGQPGGPGGGKNNGGKNNTGNKNTTKPTKTFTQSVTAKMSCAHANTTMADPAKAKAAFKKTFEKSGGATVTDTKLTKIGCGRRLETGFRRLSGDTGIKADYTYTATAAKTVDATAFTNDLNAALKAEGITNVTVTGSNPSTAVDVTPTQAPASTTKQASSAQKTSLFFVSFSFVQLALAWC